MLTSTLPRTSLAALTLTDTPTLGQLQIWWEAMQNDPTRYLVYTDFMPTEFEEFLAPVQHGHIQVHLMRVGPAVGSPVRWVSHAWARIRIGPISKDTWIASVSIRCAGKIKAWPGCWQNSGLSSSGAASHQNAQDNGTPSRGSSRGRRF